MPAGIDPQPSIRGFRSRRLPRARGDRPAAGDPALAAREASPCPRGSTRNGSSDIVAHPGFPVPAGIDPRRGSTRNGRFRLPRARGDRPAGDGLLRGAPQASPCPRGSTPSPPQVVFCQPGFPVPAGIDPRRRRMPLSYLRLPRARGDRPRPRRTARRQRRASPCPRGSTLRRRNDGTRIEGFPVPAGIDPLRCPPAWSRAWLPRARGDRPAHRRGLSLRIVASPCPRGSTPASASVGAGLGGFPVPAGIDPRRDQPGARSRWLPRARGDRPSASVIPEATTLASPCPRGSTPGARSGREAGGGFPVPAGIDPARRGLPARQRGLPRARGDRPLQAASLDVSGGASPCPRGSTQCRPAPDGEGVGFPVPAGIDPPSHRQVAVEDGLPRARGDRPRRSCPDLPRRRASPCPRGST